jgi:transcription initiation factor TFIIIB Brf1 subunit/transcription initiation factor TFIIB
MKRRFSEFSKGDQRKICPSCGSEGSITEHTEIGGNTSGVEGSLICEKCGYVVEECFVRLELELQTDAQDRTRPVGTLLSNSEARNSLLAAEPSQSVNSLANKASYIEIAKVNSDSITI